MAQGFSLPALSRRKLLLATHLCSFCCCRTIVLSQKSNQMLVSSIGGFLFCSDTQLSMPKEQGGVHATTLMDTSCPSLFYVIKIEMLVAATDLGSTENKTRTLFNHPKSAKGDAPPPHLSAHATHFLISNFISNFISYGLL